MSWDPGREVVRAIVDYRWAKTHELLPGPWLFQGLSSVRRKLAVARHRFWSVVAGCDVPINSMVSDTVELPHPTGVVIHPDVFVSAYAKIFSCVTLGTSKEGSGVPYIGANAEIGTGAKVLGRVRIGAGAKVGANAVVLSDVPAFAIVGGVPAQLIGWVGGVQGAIARDRAGKCLEVEVVYGGRTK